MHARAEYLIAVVALAAGLALGGEPRSCVLRVVDAPAVPLSGNARVDFSSLPGSGGSLQDAVGDASQASRKSPWLAAGLSIVLPGAGEFYSESYIKSGLFFAAEAALWALAYAWDHKGDKQTDFFQNYANAHWSVVAYAQYALANYAPANGNYQVIIPNTSGDPPWMRINWSELNRMEQDIGATANGSYYSHILPIYNTQQYYELIGKYPQFNQGWDDAPPSFSYGGTRSNEALYYDGQRGQANTYYTTASTFVGIAVINHVASAIDAALSAGSYNRGLHASVETLPVPNEAGGYTAVPALHLAWGF
ncbi:MAG TPA: hypothetical protein VL221_08370 [Bacteroidota bacterium]|nr:hypothetical protein [Bacteroidota bacterium]